MSKDEDKTRVVRGHEWQKQVSPEPSDKDATRKMDRGNEGGKNKPDAPPDEGHTILKGPRGNKQKEGAAFDPLAPSDEGAEIVSDPVVGWLVVVKGPGRGNALCLGYGFNSIGRDSSQRVQLNFGDSQISRLNHVRLLYDVKSRKFTMTLGDGVNPSYVRGETLLGPTELKSGDRIQIGETELLFIALCGEDFEWSDNI